MKEEDNDSDNPKKTSGDSVEEGEIFEDEDGGKRKGKKGKKVSHVKY